MFENCRILVVGDVMLDRYWFGSAERVSPEAPVPIVNVEDAQSCLGGAANVARNLVGLGANVHLIGSVGDDAAGRELATLSDEIGIESELVADTRVATTVKQRVISSNQQLMRLDFGTSQPVNASVAAAELDDRVASALANSSVDVVVCSDYAKGALDGVAGVIECAHKYAVPVVVDPKRPDWTAYRGADIVTPNADELAAAISGSDTTTDDGVIRAAEMARSRYAIGAMLVTRSQRGMTLVNGADSAIHLSAQAREVFDVTGAGDTVTALVAAGLASGEPLATAAERANRGAGAVVGRLGTTAPTHAELDKSNAHGVSADQLAASLAWIQNERAAGARVVFTNGCFDLLHPGHVDLLRRARAFGDRLVVAVNDDASVARLKGVDRPIQTISTRMAVLSALADVDCVVCFGEDTPAVIIEEIRPDVLVKGGDYRVADVVGGEFVRANGGRVEILEHLPGYSTTATLADLKQSGSEQ
ncbi:bifunctional D-glycero-beta-D-manno-heptose-7-phosphate kinase/D-glycero-beta-D-manno-heptose 1-phosphate adenylyltransferase HldE [Salinisphaera orenii]|uniref:bifunctional D-glycero-beta-D-manno-heptose-7-phosphate kinase/D-glycero-beta-D-manno-heptose 1-phosphate adenylyltransferase HldE n=1 Tax=Salinisphaera orenii TaxID=856731 RepID=UPI00296F3A5A